MKAIGKRGVSVGAHIKNLSALILFTVVIIVGCNRNYFVVKGRIVSYEYVTFKDVRLRYFVIADKKVIQTGTAKIGLKGDYLLRIKAGNVLPLHVVIEGLDVVPEVSAMGNSVEIRRREEKTVYMGDVFIYDPIKIKKKPTSTTKLRDINLEWESDIPNIDSFKVELIGKASGRGSFSAAMSVAGIKGSSFSFSRISGMLQTLGKVAVGELVVVNNNPRIEGMYFLDVVAVRLINGKEVAVAKSETEIITIIRD